MSQGARNVLQESFADKIRSLIKNVTHDPEYYGIAQSLHNMGTTHVSVLAEDGSAVSVTSSINHMSVSGVLRRLFHTASFHQEHTRTYKLHFPHRFGSAVLSPRTGVILNNQLSDFCGRVKNISPGNHFSFPCSRGIEYSEEHNTCPPLFPWLCLSTR